MANKMRRAINILYPEEFKAKSNKKPQPGFFIRQWNSFNQFLQNFGKLNVMFIVMSLVGLSLFGYGAYAYNHFTAYSNGILSARARVSAETQRRNDLINNLVPPTLNYSIYEKDLFSHVVEIRKELTSINSKLGTEIDINSDLAGQLGKQIPALLGIFENYPDLKASQPFADLMKELVETENRIAASRRALNETIRIYNTYIAKVPAAWVARILRYKPEQWFKANKEALIVPDMKILDSMNLKK